MASAPAARYSLARLHRVVEAVDAACVGAGDDHEIGVALRRDGRADLGGHCLGLDKRLARKMPAAFGHLLIFEMNARRACLFEQPNRAFDVERLAEPGVGVAKQR